MVPDSHATASTAKAAAVNLNSLTRAGSILNLCHMISIAGPKLTMDLLCYT